MKWILLVAILVICDLSATSAKGHRGRSHHNHGGATPQPHEGSPFNDGETPLHHELTNRMPSDKEYRRDHPPGTEERARVTISPVPNASVTPSLRRTKKVAPIEPKKNVLHKNAMEHNVNKKQLEIQDGIPMEKEFLIHVTKDPASARKAKKLQASKRRATTLKPGTDQIPAKNNSKPERGHKPPSNASERSRRGKLHQQNVRGSTGGAKRGGKGSPKNTNKNHRYPKKYNSQKHSLKKNQKKENQKREKMEKNKERREKMNDKMKERREKRNKKGYTSHKDEERNI